MLKNILLSFIGPYLIINIISYPNTIIRLLLWLILIYIYTTTIILFRKNILKLKKSDIKDIFLKGLYCSLCWIIWGICAYIMYKIPKRTPILFLIQNIGFGKLGMLIVSFGIFLPALVLSEKY